MESLEIMNSPIENIVIDEVITGTNCNYLYISGPAPFNTSTGMMRLRRREVRLT